MGEIGLFCGKPRLPLASFGGYEFSKNKKGNAPHSGTLDTLPGTMVIQDSSRIKTLIPLWDHENGRVGRMPTRQPARRRRYVKLNHYRLPQRIDFLALYWSH